MIATDTGQLVIFVTDEAVDDRVVASVMDSIASIVKPLLIDGTHSRDCAEIERSIAAAAERNFETENRQIIIKNLLDPFYVASIPTREAAQILGRVKSTLESMAKRGAHIVLICQRRSDDLGTRSHFMASLCASADRVHFRRST